MWKLLSGPLLMGAAYIGGSIYGRDAEQIVHKSPSETSDAIDATLANIQPSGTTHFEGGTPMPYEIKVAHGDNRHLTVTVLFDGKQGAAATIDFLPQDGGKATLITAQVHGDHAVLRQALAGTDKAKLAYAPDWMLNLSARPLLAQIAGEVERGEMSDPTQGPTSQAEWEGQLPPDQREQVQEWRQYDAARPTTNPDADAQQYMNGDRQ